MLRFNHLYLASVSVYKTLRHSHSLSNRYLVKVIESRTETHNFRCRISYGQHNMYSCYEPTKSVSECGATPKELLLAALGSCTVMSIRTYFNNTSKSATPASEWYGTTLDEISISMNECGADHTPSNLSMSIYLSGKLSDHQKSRLLLAASTCPVKKMLTQSIPVDINLIDNKD